MEVENALSMSLDDIISKQKKTRPVAGSKKPTRPGQKPRQSPKVFKDPKGNQRSGPQGKHAQNSNRAPVRKSGSQKAPSFAMKRRPTQTGAITKPARKGPNTQAIKGKQSGAPKVVPGIQAPKRKLSTEGSLKVTITNDRVQKPVLPRPQARPVIPMPSQNQLVMPGQAQPSRMRPAGHMTNGYTPSVQQMERDYPVAAQPVRQPYPDAVGRGFNNAASYLRDPYRGDDFDRGSLGGMRSDVPKHNGRTQRDTRAYDSILDDSLREDDNYGRGRTNSYTNERQGGRNNREAYRR